MWNEGCDVGDGSNSSTRRSCYHSWWLLLLGTKWDPGQGHEVEVHTIRHWAWSRGFQWSVHLPKGVLAIIGGHGHRGSLRGEFSTSPAFLAIFVAIQASQTDQTKLQEQLPVQLPISLPFLAGGVKISLVAKKRERMRSSKLHVPLFFMAHVVFYGRTKAWRRKR